MNKNLITREGKERFEQELRHLIEVEQPKNLEDLAAARAQGDLSENADYDAARKKQGEIEARIREIEEILGLTIPKSTILIGMGNLGKAVTMHLNFESKGFNIVGLFDSKPSLVGQMVRNLPIRSTSDIDEFCREFRPEVAILCIPKEAAEEISEQLISLGIKGFLNFSHYDISVKHKDVQVENVHLGDSLMTLSYKLKND